MDTKLRCKIGNIEIEYEGSIAILRDDIPNIIHKMLESVRQHTDIGAINNEPGGARQVSGHSTNTIASMLGAKTGADLVIAACANLTFSKGQEILSRKDILAEMQESTTFYKASYSANLSKSLDTLVKGSRLNLRSRNQYSLSPAERKNLGETLAQHQ